MERPLYTVELKLGAVLQVYKLLDDAKTKGDKGNGIDSELATQQTDDEEHLDRAVAEKIEGIEV